jgi:hypothetical protein
MADSAPAQRRIHIVVTCANRKTRVVPQRLRLGDLRGQQPGERLDTWIDCLTGTPEPAAPAASLYAGEHWGVARQLHETAGLQASLWICSAGYGLIPAGAPIKPYAATFALGEPDSVGENRPETRDWWKNLARWEGPTAGQPRSFTDLARSEPGATIVAVLSDAYLRACADDLRTASAALTDTEQLTVVGPPQEEPGVNDLVVEVTARLRPVVGGSMQALNVRAARHLLALAGGDTGKLHRSHLRQLAQQATAAAPVDRSRRPTGERMTDDEVRAFIRSQIAAGPTTATRCLRALRESARSCEQSRFKQLFHGVAAEVSR